MSFHKRLKQLRSNSGITVLAISEKTGIAVSSYRHLEYGRVPKDIMIFEKLSKMFGVSLSYLMYGEETLSDELLTDLEAIKEKVRSIRAL